MSSGDDKPLDFWSRRKAAVREAEAAETERRDAELETAKRVELEEKTDAEILEELGLPDPDSLQKDDDFTRFLAKTVPERLRRRALRRLWLSNPVLANLDGLNDYEDDYTDAATAGQVVKTAYQVGRGFLKKVAETATSDNPETSSAARSEMLREQSDSAAPQQEELDATQHTDDENGKTSIRLTQTDEAVQISEIGTIVAEETALVEAKEEHAPKRRRMRFDFD
ncbi:DUF3306 domain-containing protein [Roseibium sp. FZY0029]|uniref:DUF3306 domain-containing protein n=1 Tax=Roseibium sp. FZY0029 TaxID=3116647 RepID=UPI002EC3475F|nr:DUF3306 domain-containing protein [Roseibium sp. FZY0029]